MVGTATSSVLTGRPDADARGVRSGTPAVEADGRVCDPPRADPPPSNRCSAPTPRRQAVLEEACNGFPL